MGTSNTTIIIFTIFIVIVIFYILQFFIFQSKHPEFNPPSVKSFLTQVVFYKVRQLYHCTTVYSCTAVQLYRFVQLYISIVLLQF